MIFMPQGLTPFEHVVKQFNNTTDMVYTVDTYPLQDIFFDMEDMKLTRTYTANCRNGQVCAKEFRGKFSVDDAYLHKFWRVEDECVYLIACCGFIYAYILETTNIEIIQEEISLSRFKKFFSELPITPAGIQMEDLIHG